jgi:hypothetical protein
LDDCNAIISNCDFTDNQDSGVDISTGGDVQINNCRFFRGWTVGLYIHEISNATVASNEIFANGLSGIVITFRNLSHRDITGHNSAE